jgi:dethiobiotin synthetase
MKAREFFISGIDTDCGKTYVTGLMAYNLQKSGIKTISTKLVQTGCEGISEDILEHRRIMKSDILEEDKSILTCPFVFTYPASPHLATKIDKRNIDLDFFRRNTSYLLSKYNIVLSEGAGGLMVPIKENYLTLDYIKDNNLDLILVTSSKLGSINHTIMSLEICKAKKINLKTVIYNHMPGDDDIISQESYEYFKHYIKKNFKKVSLVHINDLKENNNFNLLEKITN